MLHEGGRSRARLWWVLELGGSFLGANFPFLPAGLVCSVVLGLILRAGLVQVLQLLLLADSLRL